jgi:hypothetical protein
MRSRSEGGEGRVFLCIRSHEAVTCADEAWTLRMLTSEAAGRGAAHSWLAMENYWVYS